MCEASCDSRLVCVNRISNPLEDCPSNPELDKAAKKGKKKAHTDHSHPEDASDEPHTHGTYHKLTSWFHNTKSHYFGQRGSRHEASQRPAAR